MAGRRVEVLNLDEVLAAFEAASAEMQRKALKAMAQAGGEVVRKRAAELAPRRTGELAESIVATNPRSEKGRAVVDVGPDKKHFYGMFVEVGTKTAGAQPFLRPAIDETVDEATAAARDAGRAVMGW